MKTFTIILGDKIKRLRKRKGISQERLAEMANISSKYLGEIERGRVNISIIVLYNLAKSLDVEMSELIDNETDKINFENEIQVFLKKATPEQIHKLYTFIKNFM